MTSPLPTKPLLARNLLGAVGRTPLVQIQRCIQEEVSPGVEVWAKVEALNPGGSVKDRAAAQILSVAEEQGLVGPGSTLLDASSGNTGIAYAMAAASKGYKLKLCLPANANAERKRILRSLGVELILTSPLEGSDGAIVEARRLAEEDPSLFYCDQYSNNANWQAHYTHTGPEIWAQTDGRITHFATTLGTSGTFMGVTRFLKDQDPEIQCFTIEPDSPFHGLEGLKHMTSAIVPAIYDPEVADGHLGAPTEASLSWVRRLAKEEGLLVGISSGAALWGALEIAKELEQGVVVTVFPDGGERYLSEPHVWEEPS
ncbi:MAG: cysteine synthase family protein [Myxococcota bacterium]|nr:cysteine synthase family protein [Myxococcota bacterium]